MWVSQWHGVDTKQEISCGGHLSELVASVSTILVLPALLVSSCGGVIALLPV